MNLNRPSPAKCIDDRPECKSEATVRRDAPGVYVAGAKLASLGLRVRRGCSYHGLALNIDMDLEPFARINPCGFADMPVTQLSALGVDPDIAKIQEDLLAELLAVLGRKAAPAANLSP